MFAKSHAILYDRNNNISVYEFVHSFIRFLVIRACVRVCVSVSAILEVSYTAFITFSEEEKEEEEKITEYLLLL